MKLVESQQQELVLRKKFLKSVKYQKSENWKK